MTINDTQFGRLMEKVDSIEKTLESLQRIHETTGCPNIQLLRQSKSNLWTVGGIVAGSFSAWMAWLHVTLWGVHEKIESLARLLQ